MFLAFQRGFQVIALFSCTQAMKGPSENLQCKNDQSLSVDANPLDLFDEVGDHIHILLNFRQNFHQFW